jgi:hypothetical protein
MVAEHPTQAGKVEKGPTDEAQGGGIAMIPIPEPASDPHVLPALHPDHLADLRKSGLSDETITKADLYAVRAGDIGKITANTNISSLLAIPYDAEFKRYKVFPPISRGATARRSATCSRSTQECISTSHPW